jgi:hypothetical protein
MELNSCVGMEDGAEDLAAGKREAGEPSDKKDESNQGAKTSRQQKRSNQKVCSLSFMVICYSCFFCVFFGFMVKVFFLNVLVCENQERTKKLIESQTIEAEQSSPVTPSDPPLTPSDPPETPLHPPGREIFFQYAESSMNITLDVGVEINSSLPAFCFQVTQIYYKRLGIPFSVSSIPFNFMMAKHGCHADVFGRTDARTDDRTMAAGASVTWTHCSVLFEVTWGKTAASARTRTCVHADGQRPGHGCQGTI